MRKVVCFDLRCLQIGHENRGIGMHVRSILTNLRPGENVDYIFYAFDKNDPIKALGIRISVPYKLVQTRSLNMSISRPRDILHLSKVILHKFSALKSIQYDYFIQFDFMLGLPPKVVGKQNVLIAYDLIPLIFRSDYMPTPHQAANSTRGLRPKLKQAVRSAYYTWRYRFHYANFNKADSILSISQSTARSLTELLNISPKKVTTVPLAPVFNSTIAQKPSKLPHDLGDFIFYIGATDARKRVQDLICAYGAARDYGLDFKLILAGKEFEKPGKIPNNHILKALAKTKYKSDIHFLGFITDEEKLWLYKHALAFVFPSVYEGFGIPVIEAMQAGCVAISYNNSSIPEISGDAAVLIETGNVGALTNSIKDIVTNSARREQLRAKGLVQAKQFSWSNYMDAFYNFVLQKGQRNE